MVFPRLKRGERKVTDIEVALFALVLKTSFEEIFYED